jgi:hypothetical protein
VTLAPSALYLNDPECLLVVFDLRQAGAAEALHRLRAAWVEYSDVETLDEEHFALIMRPGWASEPAA